MTSEEKDIKVVDRRKFNSDGSIREDRVEEEADEPVLTPSPEPPPAEPTPRDGATSQAALLDDAPKPDKKDSLFISLLSSLAASAQMALGLLPNPASGLQTVNLDEARQVISMLDVLEQKTLGNLNEREKGLLHSLIYELKIQFVSAQKPPPAP